MTFPEALPPSLAPLIERVARPEARFHACSSRGELIRSSQAPPPLVAPGAHQYEELVICAEGSMQLVSDEEVYLLHAGDAVLIGPQAPHYETWHTPQEPYRSFWLMISPGAISSIEAHYAQGAFSGLQAHGLPLSGEEALLAQIRIEFQEKETFWELKARALLLSLLITYERRCRTGAGLPRLWEELEPVQRLLYLARTRFREPLQLKTLAQEVGLSADHLSRRFHATYGVTFKDYLNTTRLNHARRLLREGQPIKAAADASGFSEVAYFSRVFKEASGMTPGQFIRSGGPSPSEG